jgi:LTXXQ motif family protein
MLKAVTGLAAVLVVASAALAQQPSPQSSPSQLSPAQVPSAPGPAPQAPLRQDTHQDTPAQETSPQRLSQADLNALTDARIGMARSMLQLTPEQAQFWPPVEEAMRNSAEARYRRIAERQTMMDRALADRAGEREYDPVAMMRSRGDALSERGAQLRKLADAWQPLYQTLNPEQRDRMRLIASHILGETGGAMGSSDRPEDEEGDED